MHRVCLYTAVLDAFFGLVGLKTINSKMKRSHSKSANFEIIWNFVEPIEILMNLGFWHDYQRFRPASTRAT